MNAEGWVLIIGAAGSQVALALQTWKASRAVGNPNGSGSVHETLSCIKATVESIDQRLTDHVEGHA